MRGQCAFDKVNDKDGDEEDDKGDDKESDKAGDKVCDKEERVRRDALHSKAFPQQVRARHLRRMRKCLTEDCLTN